MTRHRAELHNSAGLLDTMHEPSLTKLRARIAREWVRLLEPGDKIVVIEESGS